jgi:N-methylhydantoinase A
MGPTVAGRFASDLGITRVLIPKDPGAFSAYGMLVTDVRQARRITRITQLETTTAEDLNAVFLAMEEEAAADLVRERFPRDRIKTMRSAGMRYRGQSYEVDVPVSALRSADDIADLVGRFHDAHHRRYGHMAQSEAVEIVNFEVTGLGLIPKPPLRSFPEQSAAIPVPAEIRRVHFGAGEAVFTPVYRRSDLPSGTIIDGPAVIEERTSTTVLYRGQSARVDRQLDIVVAL